MGQIDRSPHPSGQLSKTRPIRELPQVYTVPSVGIDKMLMLD
jgi:hypothetical protein